MIRTQRNIEKNFLDLIDLFTSCRIPKRSKPAETTQGGNNELSGDDKSRSQVRFSAKVLLVYFFKVLLMLIWSSFGNQKITTVLPDSSARCSFEHRNLL